MADGEATAAATAPQGAAPPPGRTYAVIGLMLGMFLAALDQTIVATALPKITEELNGLGLYAWVATSYLLASVVALPLFGRLSEVMAAKWVLVIGIGIFLAGSFLAGLAPTMPALVAFRGVQGFGGGALFALVFTVLGYLFAPRERGKLAGLFGGLWGLSSVLGPWLGGLITDHASWRWVFYVNMPVGAIALFFIVRYMPALAPARRGRFDLAGLVALAVWSVPMMLAFSWAGSTYPWTSARILGLFALAAVGLAAFVLVELRAPEPLVDLTLFRNRTFTWTSVGSIFFGGAFLGAIIFMPLYLVQVRGFSATYSGLSLTPLTLGIVAASALSGALASRIGRVKPILVAGTGLAVALFLVIHVLLSETVPLWEVLALLVVLGLSLGPSMPLYTLAVQNSVARGRLGTASSASQFARQLGSTIGVAVMGTVLATTISSQMAAHLPAGTPPAAVSGVSASDARDPGRLDAEVREQFDDVYAEVARAVEGDEAAYEAIQRDPRLPADLKKELVPGGVPAQVHAQFKQMSTAYRAALNGDAQAAAALRQSPYLPEPLKASLDHPPADPAARANLAAQLDAALAQAEPAVVKSVDQSVLGKIRQAMDDEAARLIASLRAGLNAGITDAVKKVYLYGAGLAALSLLALLFMPNELLKSTQD